MESLNWIPLIIMYGYIWITWLTLRVVPTWWMILPWIVAIIDVYKMPEAFILTYITIAWIIAIDSGRIEFHNSHLRECVCTARSNTPPQHCAVHFRF